MYGSSATSSARTGRPQPSSGARSGGRSGSAKQAARWASMPVTYSATAAWAWASSASLGVRYVFSAIASNASQQASTSPASSGNGRRRCGTGRSTAANADRATADCPGDAARPRCVHLVQIAAGEQDEPGGKHHRGDAAEQDGALQVGDHV